MPKVLFLTTALASGGPVAVVLSMARALSQRGVDCAVWGIATPEPGLQLDSGLTFRSLNLPKQAIHRETTRRLTEELSQARPEVLHLHSFTTHVHGVRAARAIGLRPTLVSFHDFRLGARRAWTCRRLAPWVDRVVVLNETMCRLYAQAGRYPPEKLFVLPNAVDTGYFSPGARDETLARQWGLGSEEYLIGSVGGLNHNKGHGFLVEAFAQVRSKLPGARLILVGAGRDRVHLEELVARLGLADRVLFAGKQTNIRSWLSLLDLYVQPSRIEADPLSVHEAMAMQLPIIGTDRGGLPELLGYGEAGLLVPPADPQALAKGILALAGDAARAQALARAARARAVKCYDLAEYGERLGELYEPLLD